MIECNAIPLFPTMVLQFHVPNYTDLLPELNKLRQQDQRGMKASNMGGWHSNYQPLPDLLSPYIPFPYTSSLAWYMVNTNLQGNYSHQHPQNDWAGVLWLKVPPNAAQLEFEHPDCFAQYKAINSLTPELQKQYNYYSVYAFPPKEGQMLLFPASLRHRVYFSNTDEERIALSFNISLP